MSVQPATPPAVTTAAAWLALTAERDAYAGENHGLRAACDDWRNLVARIRAIALVGGQDAVTVRRRIIAELEAAGELGAVSGG